PPKKVHHIIHYPLSSLEIKYEPLDFMIYENDYNLFFLPVVDFLSVCALLKHKLDPKFSDVKVNKEIIDPYPTLANYSNNLQNYNVNWALCWHIYANKAVMEQQRIEL
ncbi:hypothetical protein ACJX0J_007424, partial [Zea mays]